MSGQGAPSMHCVVLLACMSIRVADQDGAIATASRLRQTGRGVPDQAARTVAQSLLTMPPVSPESGFQSHQIRFPKLACG